MTYITIDLHRSISPTPGKPTHEFIIGDNLPAMNLLLPEYAGGVDAIYIDPPYNTGNKTFVYNDTYSSWGDFMKPRLALAKELLSDSGVIMCSIGEKEYALLKTLMDDLFGKRNFMANLIWVGSPSALSKFTSGGVDYILVYAKNVNIQKKWRKLKPFAQEMLDFVEKLHSEGCDATESTARLRGFIRDNKHLIDKGLQGYNTVDDAGRVYSDAMLTNSLSRPNLKYPITDPTTGKVYDPPENGWKLSKESMQELSDQGLILFEGRKFPRKKLLLESFKYALPASVFNADRSLGTKDLARILGKGKFSFPKNVNVIKEWLQIVTQGNKEAVILDFFAGSGTTGQAVAELNHEDDGSRRSILITTNENQIADEVTYERLRRVLTGQDWADGKEHPNLEQGLIVKLLHESRE